MDGVHHGTNGVNGVNGVTPHALNGGGAGPSKGYPTPPSTHHEDEPTTLNGTGGPFHSRPSHNESIVNHLYTSGFQHGNYADINLHVMNRPYRLHAIILARSPYLAHLINTSNTNTLYVPLEDEPLITEDGFAIALGYLYSSASMGHLTPDNSRSVLAAACFLGGMDDLAAAAYEMCRSNISAETIQDWLQLLDEPSSSPSPSSSIPGTPTMETSPAAVLGLYGKRLRDDVFSFLVVTLPVSLHAFPPHLQKAADGATETGQEVLIRIYSVLPFDVFKHAVESPAFPVGTDQARFQFVKGVIAARKKTQGGRDAEESVVLAFGKTDGGSAVHVTRKMKKKPLWKVSK
ncbi:hypothetical protein FRB95_001843 [Tulasnella sp. JGI-2019a]|nr:hypothetical protein FRB93_003755 [Tulasnella sp. JGI-2019a]KAG9032137.1 hypothetical protein FRB95_001843 [Tulasnella sp. JGI-2019a]